MTKEEFLKDLETLVGQANAIAGAIQYVKAKIAQLEKAEQASSKKET